MHPNEGVAVQMAHLVAENLKQQGRGVEIIDLEKLRKERQKEHWAKSMSENDQVKAKFFMEVLGTREGEFFDFHDSPIEGLRQSYGADQPTLELTRSGYHLVETPAVYVPQEDPEISRHAEEERMINRYFTKRADVRLSHEAGLLSTEMVDSLAKQILKVVTRREAFTES